MSIAEHDVPPPIEFVTPLRSDALPSSHEPDPIPSSHEPDPPTSSHQPDPIPSSHESDPGPPPRHAIEPAGDTLPSLARTAAGAWLRAAGWGIEASLRVGTQALRAATDPGAAVHLAGEMSSGLRAYAREFLGVADLDDRVRQLAPPAVTGAPPSVRDELALRERGTELLAHSADVHFDDEAHPAYGRILSEIVPDEGRVLRLLATAGAQPIVDVRATNLIGVGSQLVAPGLNMIGAEAGLRHRERVPAYLGNLFRLGLIAFSDEPVEDPAGYQVLEAQPDVLRAIRETTRAKITHRSVRLTEFGADFCRVCLPLTPPSGRGAPAVLEPGDRPAELPPG